MQPEKTGLPSPRLIELGRSTVESLEEAMKVAGTTSVEYFIARLIKSTLSLEFSAGYALARPPTCKFCKEMLNLRFSGELGTQGA